MAEVVVSHCARGALLISTSKGSIPVAHEFSLASPFFSGCEDRRLVSRGEFVADPDPDPELHRKEDDESSSQFTDGFQRCCAIVARAAA
jgi:hypothetical protein